MSRPVLTWRRGYPAARLLASGQVAGLTFWLQERLPGTVLASIPERRDFVHYDFTPANLLTSGAAISGVIDINPPALDVYLAHLLLRQVDWSLRHHPGALATAHHLHLARLVAADLVADAARDA